jgi:hypothetical protein
MSLIAFDSLRALRPDERPLIGRVEEWFSNSLRDDPTSVIDERVIARQLAVPEDQVDGLLVDLVDVGGLNVRFIWECPNGMGGADEKDALSDFPDPLECSQCGGLHTFHQRDIDVVFLPSSDLLAQVLER